MKTYFAPLAAIGVLLTASSAHAVDCMFDKMAVDSQNASNAEKYAAAWNDFNDEFNREKPAIQAYAASMYPKWKKIAILSPDLFADAMKQVSPDETGVIPVNDLVRIVETNLNKKFPRSGLSLSPMIKTFADDTGATKGRDFNRDQYGEPQFQICFDDDKYNPAVRMSFVCGTVTRIFVPDQSKFVSDYVDQVRSSRAINGSPDLQKPFAVHYSAECPNNAAPDAAPAAQKVAADAPAQAKPVAQTIDPPAQQPPRVQPARGTAGSDGQVGGQQTAD